MSPRRVVLPATSTQVGLFVDGNVARRIATVCENLNVAAGALLRITIAQGCLLLRVADREILDLRYRAPVSTAPSQTVRVSQAEKDLLEWAAGRLGEVLRREVSEREAAALFLHSLTLTRNRDLIELSFFSRVNVAEMAKRVSRRAVETHTAGRVQPPLTTATSSGSQITAAESRVSPTPAAGTTPDVTGSRDHKLSDLVEVVMTTRAAEEHQVRRVLDVHTVMQSERGQVIELVRAWSGLERALSSGDSQKVQEQAHLIADEQANLSGVWDDNSQFSDQTERYLLEMLQAAHERAVAECALLSHLQDIAQSIPQEIPEELNGPLKAADAITDPNRQVAVKGAIYAVWNEFGVALPSAGGAAAIGGQPQSLGACARILHELVTGNSAVMVASHSGT